MASPLQRPPDGDEDRGPQFIAAAAVTTAAALIAVCLRMYVRIRIVRAVGIDDYMIIVSMVMPRISTFCCSSSSNDGRRFSVYSA